MWRWAILFSVVAMTTACSPSSEVSEVVQFELPGGTVLTSEQVAEYRDLMDEANAAYSKDDAKACASYYREGFEIYGGNEGNRYNLACCLALAGQDEEALEELDRAIDDGFAYPDHLGDDEDLANLREQPGFQALVEKARIRKKAAEGRDPMAGEAEPGGPFSTLADLEQSFEDRESKHEESLGEARRVIGSTIRAEMEREERRDRIVALLALAAEHPEQSAEAGLLALESMAAFRPGHPSLLAAVESYLESHGDDPRAASAKMIAAVGARDGKALQDPAAEGHADAVAEVATVAAEVVAEDGDSVYSRDAHYWLLRDATLVDDRDRMRSLFGELRERWSDDEDFWDREGYHLFAARLEHDGLEAFEVESIDGEQLSLEAFRGQVTLIDFWATWCGPCIEELPRLKEIYASYHDRGFEIVGISADDEKRMDLEAFREWMQKEDMTWPQFYDGKGWQNEVLQLYGVSGIPTTILLDREGRVAGVDLQGDALEGVLRELL